jgi:hypothetical protein
MLITGTVVLIKLFMYASKAVGKHGGAPFADRSEMIACAKAGTCQDLPRPHRIKAAYRALSGLPVSRGSPGRYLRCAPCEGHHNTANRRLVSAEVRGSPRPPAPSAASCDPTRTRRTPWRWPSCKFASPDNRQPENKCIEQANRKVKIHAGKRLGCWGVKWVHEN